MNLDILGNGLFAHLAARFDEFFDGGIHSMNEIESEVASNPNDPAAFNRIGLRFLQDAKYRLAQQAFNRALLLDSEDAFARMGLACTFDAMGRHQSALEEIRNCLGSHPGLPAAVLAFDFVEHQLGDAAFVQEFQETLSVG